ncbi:hypothetical protein AAD018_015160 [Aestuariibius insulae]|uniref:hypothetical protein n=1 Tax=Aestuariibius insulae TaxID=2058287 RepID=UPI00345ED80A
MTEVIRLQPADRIDVDLDRLGSLMEELGRDAGAETMERTIRDLRADLYALHQAHEERELDLVETLSLAISNAACRIGLASLASAACAVVSACRSEDGVAIGATVARLGRISQRSLNALEDPEHLEGA